MATWQALSLLFHLAGLALWLGAIASVLVVLGPAAHRLEPASALRMLERGRSGFEAVSWAGITLVMITGAINLILRHQVTAAHLSGAYMAVLSIKLVLFVAMLTHHSLQVFRIGPRIAALSARPGAGRLGWDEPLRQQWQSWFVLLKVNATLGPIVLLLGVLLGRS
ncbi:MAG TPA: hypothetical protein VNN77_18145 [candidate division Zixibacteria bacterium]|nr:hypothetical protein [candidate division Zixibacteria bacterium]